MAKDDETATRERPESAGDTDSSDRTERSAGTERSGGSERPARDGDAPKKRVRKTAPSGTARKPGAKKPASSSSSSSSGRPHQHASSSGRPHQDASSGEDSSTSPEEDSASDGSRDEPSDESNDERQRSPSSSKPGGSRMNAARAAREAMSQLAVLTNREAEGVVGIEKNDDGSWTVMVEVCESRRIPDTADVLAVYSVTIDLEGDLTAYSRESRYVRGRTNRGE